MKIFSGHIYTYKHRHNIHGEVVILRIISVMLGIKWGTDFKIFQKSLESKNREQVTGYKDDDKDISWFLHLIIQEKKWKLDALLSVISLALTNRVQVNRKEDIISTYTAHKSSSTDRMWQ